MGLFVEGCVYSASLLFLIIKKKKPKKKIPNNLSQKNGFPSSCSSTNFCWCCSLLVLNPSCLCRSCCCSLTHVSPVIRCAHATFSCCSYPSRGCSCSPTGEHVCLSLRWRPSP